MLLAVTVVLLAIDWPVCACVSSVASVVTIHQGTALSLKNINWTLLSWPTFAVCLFAAFIQYSAQSIDEDKAYTLKFVVSMFGRGCELIWAAIMGLCLFNAWVSAKYPATVNMLNEYSLASGVL